MGSPHASYADVIAHVGEQVLHASVEMFYIWVKVVFTEEFDGFLVIRRRRVVVWAQIVHVGIDSSAVLGRGRASQALYLGADHIVAGVAQELDVVLPGAFYVEGADHVALREFGHFDGLGIPGRSP